MTISHNLFHRSLCGTVSAVGENLIRTVTEMYEELIEELRRPHADCDPWALMEQAADAIEELQEDNAALNGTVSNLIEQIAELSKPRWIPATERLPQEREWVLCQCRAKIRMVLRLQNGYWHQDSRHEFMSGFVTHWMPLPEPPQEET